MRRVLLRTIFLLRSPELAGLVAGLLMLLLGLVPRTIYVSAGWLLVAISVTGMVGACVVAGLWHRAGMQPSEAVRRGMMASALAVWVAISCLLCIKGAGLHLRILSVALLSVMPAVFYSMLAAGLLLLICGTALGTTPVLVEPLSRCTRIWLRVGIIVAGLAAIVSAMSRSMNVVTGRYADTGLLPYQVPEGMASAHALQWRLAGSQLFTNLNPNSVTLSQDGQLMAYASLDGATVAVADLHAAQPPRRLPVPYRVKWLAFSPDNEQLMLQSAPPEAQLFIMKLANGQMTALPKPLSGGMPDAPMLWWQNRSLLFITKNPPEMLDLDRLEFDDSSNNNLWQKQSPSTQFRQLKLAAGGFCDLYDMRWKAAPFIESVKRSDASSSPRSLICKTSDVLTLEDTVRDTRRQFVVVRLNGDERVFEVRDGSKLVIVSQTSAQVLYFNLGPSPPLTWTVPMPCSLEDSMSSAALSAGLSRGQAGAFVYAPLFNPLTQQVVGPDRSHVKAVLRLRTWKDKSAEFYLHTLQRSMSEGDIIADMMVWKDDKPERMDLRFDAPWWAKLPAALEGSHELANLPTHEAIARQQTEADAEEQRQLDSKREAEAKARREAERAKAIPPPSPKKPEPAGSISMNVPAKPLPEPTVEEQIKLFLLEHHQKSEASDLEGFVRGYAAKVDHFDNGIRDRAWIMESERAYHQKVVVEQESVAGNIRITQLPGNNGYTATYLLKVITRDKQTSKTGGGLFEVNLVVIKTPQGFEIIRQRAERKN